MKPESHIAHAFAVAWNRLDISGLELLLAEDVHYASQNVFEELEGKDAVLEYLNAKIQTIRGATSNYKVYAELGETQSYPAGRPCVLLAQGDANNIGALVLFDVQEGKAKRIDLCTVAPHPSSARRTGEYPI